MVWSGVQQQGEGEPGSTVQTAARCLNVDSIAGRCGRKTALWWRPHCGHEGGAGVHWVTQPCFPICILLVDLKTTRGRCHKRPRPLHPRQLHGSCFWTKCSGSQQTPARLPPGSRGSVPAQTRWVTGSRRPPPGETFNSLHWFKQHYCVTGKYFKKGSMLCLRQKENANASHSNRIWLFWEILWTIHEVNHALMNWFAWLQNELTITERQFDASTPSS